MKQLITIPVFILLGLFSFGQQIIEIPNHLEPTYPYQPKSIWNFDQPFNYPKAKMTAIGVYALPQDNMPCLVPDLHLLKSMPNARPADIAMLFIPNPYLRQQIIPAGINSTPGKLWKSISLHPALMNDHNFLPALK